MGAHLRHSVVARMSDTPQFTAREFAQQASGLLERRRYDHASQVLAEALTAYPDDADLLYHCAHLDYLQDEVHAAQGTLHSLLARHPEHFGAQYLLASVCEDTGELVQAEAILLDMLHGYPEASVLYAKYALLMFRTNHHRKAKALAREALRLDPEEEMALLACMIGDLIDGHKLDKRNFLAEMMQRHPESLTTAHMLITHLKMEGKYRSAMRMAVELLRARPDSAEALNLVVELELLSHWSMWPLWPFNRFGVAATVGFFVFTLILFNMLNAYAPEYSSPVFKVVLVYVLYSWFYPPILGRWLKRRALR